MTVHIAQTIMRQDEMSGSPSPSLPCPDERGERRRFVFLAAGAVGSGVKETPHHLHSVAESRLTPRQDPQRFPAMRWR